MKDREQESLDILNGDIDRLRRDVMLLENEVSLLKSVTDPYYLASVDNLRAEINSLADQLENAEELLEICVCNIHDEDEDGSICDLISEYFKNKEANNE